MMLVYYCEHCHEQVREIPSGDTPEDLFALADKSGPVVFAIAIGLMILGVFISPTGTLVFSAACVGLYFWHRSWASSRNRAVHMQAREVAWAEKEKIDASK